MTTYSKPEVILTHESDLDGFVAGLLLRRLAATMFGEEVRLLAYHNQAWRNRPMTERSAWVCDLTFDARLDKTGWLIVDHHVTDVPARQATLICDTAKSASLLCYDLCCAQGLASPVLERLVHLSNVADLFLTDHPDFAVASDYANLVKSYQFWNLYEVIDGQLERLLDHPLLEVMAVKRRVEDPIGFEWSRAHITPLSPQVGFVDTVLGNINLVIHRLLQENVTPFPVLVTLFRKSNGLVVASLRSRGGEALKVAEQLKGGGHPNAAGATLPRSIQQIPDAVAYLKKILNPEVRPSARLNNLESVFDGLSLPQS